MSQTQNPDRPTEEEMIGLQYQANKQRKEEKLGAYYKWASRPDEEKTVEDDALKGYLSKDIKLANFDKSQAEELNLEIEMMEDLLRCLRPAGKDDPSLETQFLSQKAHLQGIISSGKGGFERNAQKTQVSRREVATSSEEKSGGIRGKIKGVFR